MNVELLRRIAKVIQEQPDEFNMESWHSKCGTAHCIGGWAMVLSGAGLEESKLKMQQVLGIDYSQGCRLFYIDEWPRQFISHNRSSSWGYITTPVRAAARIEHFIATEGRE